MSYALSLSQKIGNTQRLEPFPSLDFGFSTSGYVNDGGFANQQSVGSSNFLIPSYSGPSPVFSRATAATFRGSNGLIQYAPENLLTYSEDFTTTWGKPAIGVSSNVAVSPLGTTTADLIYPSSSGTAREIFVGFTYTAGISYVASVYAKYAGKQWITLGTNNGTVANRCGWFDILNGVKGQIASGYQSQIENVGNGWYRIIVIFSSSTSPYFDISIVDADGSGSVTKSGTDGAYIWGAQLERSSTARPYISTTTTERYGPRFEYDANGNPLGLLMEESSTNLLSYSEQFDVTASWTPNQVTVAPNQIASPSGLVNADRLTTNGSAAVQRIGQNSTLVGVSTYSIYVKAGTASFIQILHGSSVNVYANFNVSTGVAGNVGSSAASSITSIGDGWYRCVVSATIGSTSSWYFYITNSNTATYGAAFSATVANLYVWGAQLEAKKFATSYMPTLGGTATRNADVLSLTVGSWFNQDEGTIVVSGDRNHVPSLNASLYDSFYEFSDGAGGYHSAHFSDGTTEEFFGDTGAYATSAVGIATIGTLTSIASSYSSNDIYTTRDGVTPNSAASATFLTTPTTLNIGYSQAITEAWNGHIKSFRYFPKALPNNLQRYSEV